MDIFDRVKKLADIEGISISALEQELNFSNKSLYRHKKDSTIRGDRVVVLARRFHVTTDYLLTGEDGGEYLTLDSDEQDIINRYRMLNDEGKDELKTYADFLSQRAIYKKSDSVEAV